MRGGALIRWTALDLARASKVGVATVRILRRAAMRLRQLDAATRIEDLRLPPSLNRLDMKKSGLVAIHPGEFLAEVYSPSFPSREHNSPVRIGVSGDADFARCQRRPAGDGGSGAVVRQGARPVRRDAGSICSPAMIWRPRARRCAVNRRRSNRWHHPVETSAMMLMPLRSSSGRACADPRDPCCPRTVPPQGDFVL